MNIEKTENTFIIESYYHVLSDDRWDLDWSMDLFATYTNDPELQAVTAPPLITKAPAKHFPACCVFTSRSLVTASNSGHSSPSKRSSPLFTVSCTELT
jgi:hypothetical protein